MRVNFARHGQSEANLLNEFSNRGRKHPLTPLGRQQAEALAESLLDVGIHHIYSSPLLRALDTAEILAGRLNIPYTVTPALAEHDVGILEGNSDAESWQRNTNLWKAWFEAGDFDAKIEDGESLNELQARFFALIGDLQARHSDATLLLITHGGLLSAVLPLLCVNLTRDFVAAHPMGNCGFALAAFADTQWTCETWAGAACPSNEGSSTR